MLLSGACLISALASHAPFECFSFHCCSALWWMLSPRRSYRKTIKGDDGLCVVALPASDVRRALYAATRLCAFPMVPHVYAAVPFAASAWLGLPSAQSSNVALFACSFFFALSLCFDDFVRFATPLAGTVVSLVGHCELSHRIDDRTKRWVALGHGCSAGAAFLYCAKFDFIDFLAGMCAGVLYSEACLRAATSLTDAKGGVATVCKVGAAASLLTLPARFYAETSGERKVAAAAELLLAMSSVWFYTFAAEWRAGKARPAGTAAGYALLVLGAVHVVLHKIYFH